MNEMNLDWDDLKLFLAVARAGGLAGAVGATGKSAPTLGRRMLALEEITGSELFRRLARGYELTESGTALLEKVAGLEAQIAPLDRSREADRAPVVKISAGSWMTHVLCQQVQTILADGPPIRLRFISAEHVLDIAHRETVIGLRNRRPMQSGLACRKLGRVQFAGYATSKSVKPWARVVGKTPSSLWLAKQAQSPLDIEVTAPRNALDLALTGAARAVLPTFIGDAQEGLNRVTPAIGDLEHDQWLVTHQDDRFRPEVRLTIDRLYDVARSLHRRSR